MEKGQLLSLYISIYGKGTSTHKHSYTLHVVEGRLVHARCLCHFFRVWSRGSEWEESRSKTGLEIWVWSPLCILYAVQDFCQWKVG